MRLADKIRDRRVAFFFRGDISIAFELGLLYFILARRKKADTKVIEACQRAAYWLNKAGADIPEYFTQLSPGGMREEIERILVANTVIIEKRSDLMLLISEATVLK